MNENKMPRRQFLKIGGGVIAMIPIMVASNGADAATSAALRTSLKYQTKPEGDKSCAKCINFIPGASAKASGGCKVIPGDTEISPQGYCIAWARKA